MKNRIIIAATEEINLRGFKFTMGDLAKRLSISKSSLYEQFSSKSELIATLIEMAFEDIRRQEEDIYGNNELSIGEKFQALFTVSPKLFGPISDQIYNDLSKEYPDQWNKVIESRQARLNRLTSLINQGIEEGLIRPINLKVFRQLIIGAMNHLFDFRFLAETNMTYQDAIAALSDLMLKGMLTSDN